MNHVTKKVLIAGGTGFLGYNATLKFLERNVEVGVFCLPSEIELGGWFPEQVRLLETDLFRLSQAEIVKLIQPLGYDTFIYALGPDDRVLPRRPAYAFFHEKLVEQAKKICAAAKLSGIKRCVVLNSYYSHFDRLLGQKLSRHNPYIKVRIEQEEELCKLGETGLFDIMFLELPFIFGTMPQRKPLWKEHFLDHFGKFKRIYFPKCGGTATIDVSGVAEAIVACAYNGKNLGMYPIGKLNITYEELLGIMLVATKDKRRVVMIPSLIAGIGGWFMGLGQRLKGRESGLHFCNMMTHILNKKFYIDYETFSNELDYKSLGFTGGIDVISSIKATMSSLTE